VSMTFGGAQHDMHHSLVKCCEQLSQRVFLCWCKLKLCSPGNLPYAARTPRCARVPHPPYCAVDDFNRMLRNRGELFVFTPALSQYKPEAPSRKSFLFLIDESDFANLELPLNLPQQFERVPGRPASEHQRVFENKVRLLTTLKYTSRMLSRFVARALCACSA
jgi:hypothetical protein